MSGGKRLAIVVGLVVLGLAIAFALERATHPRPASPETPQFPAAGAEPRRIITLAPSLTECLFALGVGDRIVGVGDYCFYPPEAKAKPRAGGEFNPNLERLLALRPDLVVVQGRAEKVDAFCRRNGIRILHVGMEDLDTIYSGLRELGRAVGRPAEADRLAASLRLDLARVAQRVAGRPRPKVFLCTNHLPGSLRSLFSAGGNTFPSQLLSVAGGNNVMADAVRYPQVSKEGLIERAPDVILDLHPGEDLSGAVRRQLIADWDYMPTLPAVRGHCIHVLTDDYLLLPGPRVGQAAARLAQVLHPDVK